MAGKKKKEACEPGMGMGRGMAPGMGKEKMSGGEHGKAPMPMPGAERMMAGATPAKRRRGAK